MNLVRFLNIPEDRICKRVHMTSELPIGDDIGFAVDAGGLTIRWEGEDAEANAQVFRLDLDVHNTERLEQALARYRSGT
jgi:hypothetical protein